jgi:outer membrane immunogenic protein
MRQSILAAAAAFAVASGAMIGQAAAADLDFMPAPAPPPFVPTWQGFYVGGHLGYGEGTSDYRQDVDIFVDDGQGNLNFFRRGTFRDSVNPDGFIGGVQGGYNWQMNNFVLGIEGDISFTDWDASSTVFDTDAGDLGGPFGDDRAYGTSSTDIDFLASVRGRVGYAMDSVLIYGTGGVAWAEGDARARMVAVDDGVVVEERSGKGSLSDMGWVAGGGLAWMVIPQTMSVGVEGLYYWFKDSTTLIDETVAFEGGEADIRATAELHDAWVVRARADFHF